MSCILWRNLTLILAKGQNYTKEDLINFIRRNVRYASRITDIIIVSIKSHRNNTHDIYKIIIKYPLGLALIVKLCDVLFFISHGMRSVSNNIYGSSEYISELFLT